MCGCFQFQVFMIIQNILCHSMWMNEWMTHTHFPMWHLVDPSTDVILNNIISKYLNLKYFYDSVDFYSATDI